MLWSIIYILVFSIGAASIIGIVYTVLRYCYWDLDSDIADKAIWRLVPIFLSSLVIYCLLSDFYGTGILILWLIFVSGIATILWKLVTK